MTSTSPPMILARWLTHHLDQAEAPRTACPIVTQVEARSGGPGWSWGVVLDYETCSALCTALRLSTQPVDPTPSSGDLRAAGSP